MSPAEIMLTIDGSQGEGGGQILRTSLALSLVTGKPFRILKIRAGRKKPGLLHQHLTTVNAAAEVGRAKVTGARIGSQDVIFTPKHPTPGAYHFAVGTAGSATLVLQTILSALVMCCQVPRLPGQRNRSVPAGSLEGGGMKVVGKVGDHL